MGTPKKDISLRNTDGESESHMSRLALDAARGVFEKKYQPLNAENQDSARLLVEAQAKAKILRSIQSFILSAVG